MKGSAIIKSVVGTAIIGVLLFILLLMYVPTSTAFATNNYGWNGLHDVSSTYSVASINSFSYNLNSHNRIVLLVIAPTQNFTQRESQRVLEFVQSGGVLIVADSFGVSNSLLMNLNVGIKIQQGYLVNDQLYNLKGQSLPIAFINSNQYSFLDNVRGIALNDPSPLQVTSSARIVAVSSPMSFTLNRSGQNSLFNDTNQKLVASGSFPLVALQQIGSGEIVVVGDSGFFTNSMWQSANNKVLINNLLSNSTVYVDTSHWPINTGDYLKGEFLSLYSSFSGFPLRYVLSAAFVSIAVAILPVITAASSSPKRGTMKGNNSAYNDEILKRIRRDRKRYGVE